jgi:hypothetical protein
MKIFIVNYLFLISIYSYSQEKFVILLKDGKKLDNEVSSIKSITFNPLLININLSNGNKSSNNIQNIKNIKREVQNNTLNTNTLDFDSDFEIFPNPTNSVINIKPIKFNLFPMYFEIYNLKGELVQKNSHLNGYSIESISIDVSSLSKGNYILNIFTVGNFKSKQFSIN